MSQNTSNMIKKEEGQLLSILKYY